MLQKLSADALNLIWGYVGAVSIRIKVLGIVLGVIALLGVFVTTQIRAVLSNALSQSLEEQGIALAANIAEHLAPVPPDDAARIEAILTERQTHFSSASHNTAVLYIHLEADGAPKVAVGAPPPLGTPARAYNHDQARIAHYEGSSSVLEVWYPLEWTGQYLRVGLSGVGIGQMVDKVSLQLFSTTLVMVAVGFAATFFLTWILTRPILDLVKATKAVAEGDFSQRVPRWADDEIGDLATAFNDMMAALQAAARERDAREQLRADYTQRIILAQENERQRIARELHDSTSQTLTSLLVGLQNLKQAPPEGGTLAERIEALRAIVAQTLEDIRALAWQLRPAILDDLGLPSALARYLDDYQTRYGIQVEMVVHGLEKRLPPTLETTVYRIVQEGLTNIARHADARAASVVIARKGATLKIIIEDDGRGFNPDLIENRQSLGLRGIRERAALFQGTVTIESRLGQGSSLFVELKMNEEVA